MTARKLLNFMLAWMAFFAVIAANAQTSPSQLPTKPNKLMALAAKVNGLAGLNDRPWHVKFTYQTFDVDGKPDRTGTLEEWWQSAKSYKYIYAAPGFQQTTYGDGKTEVVTGDPGWPATKIVADILGGFLWTPLPPASVAINPDYNVQRRTIGQVELTCMQPVMVSPLLRDDAVTLAATDAHRVPTTCFSDGSAAARVVIERYGLLAVLNNFVEVDGHYIAKQIALEDGNVLAATLNVVQLDFPKSIPDADLAKPTAAPEKTSELEIPPRVMARRVLSGDRFQYPEIAKTQHLSGYVVLSIDIDQNGRVIAEQGVMGPRILRDAVIQWVKTWKYNPYRVDGKAVRVKTRITVFFAPH